MKPGEKIYVRNAVFASYEDDFEKGESFNPSSEWSDEDIKLGTKGYDSIDDALKDVCNANGFSYKKKNWISYGMETSDDWDRFEGDVLVNLHNAEASQSEIEEWKNGHYPLWNCHISVWLEIRSVRAMTKDDIEF